MSEQLVREILTPGVISVGPDVTMAHALEAMRTNRISCILILEDDKPVGILTERNILQAVARRNDSFLNDPVSSLMSSPVITVREDTHVYEAYQLLSRRRMRHLVVVDAQERVVGVATLSNLVAMLENSHETGVKSISQVMTRVILIAAPQTPVRAVLADMSDRGVGSVVVSGNDSPVGILTERDVVRLLAEGRDLSELSLGDVMSSPVHVVDDARPAYEVAALMREKHIRRVVVVNEAGHITGITTQTDIVRGLESSYLKMLRGLLFDREDRLDATDEELRREKSYLENVLRSSDMGIVTTDQHLVVNSFNPAAQRIFGMSEKQVLGRDLRGLHEGWSLSGSRLAAVLGVLEPRAKHEFEVRLRLPDGPDADHPDSDGTNERILQASVSGIWCRDDALCGYVLMLADVTGKRMAEEHLERLVEQRTLDLDRKARELELVNARLRDMDRLKSNFLSSVSHELRTPLTSLLGFAKIIARDFERHFAPVAADSGELERRAERIRDNLQIMGVESERLSRLINDYLDLAKIESGHMDWHDGLLDPEKLVERAVVAAAGHFDAKPDVELLVRVDPYLPQVRADADRIHQVLINLLSNAAKFTERGRVEVLVEPRGGGLCFSVRDTGCGIAPQDVPLVFDKYRQAVQGRDTMSETRQPGTGLGLSICKEIVEHYGGFITVESEPGCGSTFHVFLPAQDS